MNAQKTFKDIVKGVNCFTPHLIAYYKIENGAIEFSTVKTNLRRGLTESGFLESVFGVTVVENELYIREKSNMFNSEKEALEYIKTFNPTQKEFYQRINCYGESQLITEKL